MLNRFRRFLHSLFWHAGRYRVDGDEDYWCVWCGKSWPREPNE